MYICSLERVNTLLQEHMITLIWRHQTEPMTCLMHTQWGTVNMSLKYICFYYLRSGTSYFTITNKTTLALTAVRAMSVGTHSLMMAVMKTKITFINIRALCICPVCFRSHQWFIVMIIYYLAAWIWKKLTYLKYDINRKGKFLTSQARSSVYFFPLIITTFAFAKPKLLWTWRKPSSVTFVSPCQLPVSIMCTFVSNVERLDVLTAVLIKIQVFLAVTP